jgi:hypothetical protein
MSRHRHGPQDATNGRFVGFVPTEAERATVAALAMGGLPQPRICEHIRRDGKPINHQTLRKYFKTELVEGRKVVEALMYRGLVHKAVVEGNVIAMIFYLKTQCGWSEKRASTFSSQGSEDTSSHGETRVFKIIADAASTSEGEAIDIAGPAPCGRRSPPQYPAFHSWRPGADRR